MSEKKLPAINWVLEGRKEILMPMSDSEYETKSALYDVLYEKADLILAEENPCSFKNGKCFAKINCCKYCNYLSKNGCTTKALTCKLWLCVKARMKFSLCAAALDALAMIAEEYSLLGSRSSKEDILGTQR